MKQEYQGRPVYVHRGTWIDLYPTGAPDNHESGYVFNVRSRPYIDDALRNKSFGEHAFDKSMKWKKTGQC